MSAALPDSPYKGLAPFGDSELDALLFFGRERDSEIVFANLLASRLTVLYAASGVGKSSLLGASVARRLRQEPNVEVIVSSSWSGDAAAPLRAAREAAETGRETYLILDQFEEFFLYHADEDGEGTLPVELPELLRQTERRVNVLISVREDALASLDAFKARIPNVFANYLRLSHLDRAAGRVAITGPLARWSDLAGEDERMEIEPALVESVLDETVAGRIELGGVGAGVDLTAADGGPGQIEAPILQLVMERLWWAERNAGSRTLRLVETLHELGGAAQIVRDHLEHALGELLPAQQDAAAAIFDHLVTPSGSKIALRAGDLAEWAGVDGGELEPVLTTLGRERILRAVDNGGGAGAERYEIFHDVLADAVLAWRAERRVQRERQEAQRRHRRLVVVAVCSLAALAVVTAIAVFALTERDRARSHERQANARELEASALSGLQSGEDNSLALALRAARVAPGAESEDVLRQVLTQSRLRGALPAKGPVTLLFFKADGRRLLVAGGDHRILLFRPSTQRLARAFADPARVTAVALGPRNLLLSGDVDGHVVLRNAASGAELARVRARGAVTSLAFDSTGRRLLVTTGRGDAAVWSARGRRLQTLEQPGPVQKGIFDPTGRLAVTIATDRAGRIQAHVFDAGTGAELYVPPQPAVQDVAFSPDGSVLATASHNGTIGLWDPGTGWPVGLLADGGGDVKDIAFNPDGTLLASAGGDGGTRVWRIADRSRLFFFPGHTAVVYAVAWSPDGRVLADASRDESAHLYAIDDLAEAGSLLATLPGNSGGATALAFQPFGTQLATGAANGGVRLWDARPEEPLAVLGFHRGGVSTASYSPDGRYVVSAGADRTARVWSLRTRKQVRVFHTPAVVRDASFSPDGKLVVTAGDDGTARLWSVQGGERLHSLGKAPPLVRARFSPDGRLVAAASGDGTVAIWRVADGARLSTARTGAKVTDVAFASDSSWIAVATTRGAEVRSVEDGRLLFPLAGAGHVNRIAVSPDGTRIATGENRGTARLWDASTGDLVHVLQGHGAGSNVTDVEFSADGTPPLLLTTSTDRDGRLWDVATGEPHAVLSGLFGVVTAGAFSPDGRWAGAADGVAAAIWQTDTGRRLFYLRGHEGQLTGIEFSPDGKQVLTSSVDGTVRTYTCRVCTDLAGLERLAEARLKRSRLGD